MAYTGIVPNAGRTLDALIRKDPASLPTNWSTFWLVLGRTAAWTDEENPPAEVDTTEAVDTPIVYGRAQVVSLAKVVESGGDVTVGGVQYALVADADAFLEGARFIYVKRLFDPDVETGIPYASFRQHGVMCGLEPAVGHESDLWLAPANVSDPGKLRYYANHTVKTLGLGDPRTIQIIFECR